MVKVDFSLNTNYSITSRIKRFDYLEVLMGNLALDNKLLNVISSMAAQLKTTKEDIIKRAVTSYAEKMKQKNRLMSFAGILDEKEADELLNSIYSNRQDRKVEGNRRRCFKYVRRTPLQSELSYRTGTIKKLLPSVRIYCPVFLSTGWT
jgi:hypothetical protein